MKNQRHHQCHPSLRWLCHLTGQSSMRTIHHAGYGVMTDALASRVELRAWSAAAVIGA